MYAPNPHLFALLAVTGLLTLGGCQNACDAAAVGYADKLEECGISDMAGDQGGECNDEEAALQECLTACAQAATCETLRGEDSEGTMALAECNNGCDT